MTLYEIIRFFYKIIKPYKHWYFIMILVPIFGSICLLLYNYATKLLIDLFTEKGTISPNEAFFPIFIFCASILIKEIIARLRDFANLKCQPALKRDISIKVYKITTKHSFSFFQDNLSGLIVSKIKGVCDGFFHIWDHLSTSTLSSFVNIFISGFSLYFINQSIFLYVLFFALFFIPLCKKIFNQISFLNQQEQEDYHRIIGLIGDRINNIFTIFHCATNDKEIKFLRNYYNESNIPKQIKSYRYKLLSRLVLSFFYLIFFIFIFIYLIHLKNQNFITTGDIAFVMSMIFIFMDNTLEFIKELSEVIKHFSDLKSSMSLILQKEDITLFEKEYQLQKSSQEKDETHKLKNLNHLKLTDFKIQKGLIEYKNIYFGYPDNGNIFNNFNLKINAGEKVALVGKSGMGKTTLMSLLLKNFFPHSGNIQIDNKSIYDINTYNLRSQISLIPQEVNLFHRSIIDNIKYAKQNATFKEVQEIVTKVEMLDVIESLPNQYDTMVGERGVKLSGGQKQRIAIARALLKESPIIIIDEATSNLDLKTENKIKKAIDNLYLHKKVTMIIIAHRLSTIKNVDRIIVLDNGQVAEDGNFEKLMQLQGLFYNMWNLQFEEEREGLLY